MDSKMTGLNMIQEAVKYVSAKIEGTPSVAAILGTGLGSLCEDVLTDETVIPYSDIPHFPVSTAPSHKSRLIAGRYHNKTVLIMQGRFHLYEGYTMQQITFPVRVMQKLGVKNLIATNASGSLSNDLHPGDIIVIEDHINFMGTNPLIGANDPELGERFPSMNDNYSSYLRGMLLDIARQEDINIKQGVYIGVTGPSMETRSECRAFARWGADMVGMSTVPEVIAAVHGGILVIGLSIVGNYSNLFHEEAHDQEKIAATAAKSYPQLRKLILKLIEMI